MSARDRVSVSECAVMSGLWESDLKRVILRKCVDLCISSWVTPWNCPVESHSHENPWTISWNVLGSNIHVLPIVIRDTMLTNYSNRNTCLVEWSNCGIPFLHLVHVTSCFKVLEDDISWILWVNKFVMELVLIWVCDEVGHNIWFHLISHKNSLCDEAIPLEITILDTIRIVLDCTSLPFEECVSADPHLWWSWIHLCRYCYATIQWLTFERDGNYHLCWHYQRLVRCWYV